VSKPISALHKSRESGEYIKDGVQIFKCYRKAKDIVYVPSYTFKVGNYYCNSGAFRVLSEAIRKVKEITKVFECKAVIYELPLIKKQGGSK
jgi:hypothetical protein